MKKHHSVFLRMLALVLVSVLCFGLMAVAASAESSQKKNYMYSGPGYLRSCDPNYDEEGGFWGQKNLKRDWVKKVEFLSAIPEDARYIFDFSENLDQSVIGWYTPHTLHIAANGTIVLSENCTGMFAGFENLEEIDFGGCVDTSRVENMSYMFHGCKNLKALDVSFFDTSKVTNMAYMFAGCAKVPELDVSKFDTSKVTNLSFMFYGCKNVEKLDVSGFKTSENLYLNSMFYNCEKVTELDVSGFDTSNVVGMCHTFAGCGAEDTVDVSKFDTSKVVDHVGFLKSGRQVDGKPWEQMF